jgi:predicted DNA-binding transcriptional regulator YafY
MRADRLVATLLLLQARGTVTAGEVAQELEVSNRTARRDLEALSIAGIPVYSIQGRGGGWRLLGGARTDLTGMQSAEARALLTMAAATGRATPAFVSAIRKLTQALPAPLRDDAERAMAAVVSDDASWRNRAGSILVEPRRDEWIEPLQLGVITHRRVALGYDTPRRGRSERIVDPLGLIIKQGVWYLLADTAAGRRSFRLDRMWSVDVTDERFDSPDDFDLGAAWDEITTSYEERSNRLTCAAIGEPWVIGALRSLGVETTVHGERGDGRLDLTLGAWNADVFAAEIAGVISGIELIDPPSDVMRRLGEIGKLLVSRYGAGSER